MHPAAPATADSSNAAACMPGLHHAARGRHLHQSCPGSHCACRCGPARHATALQQLTGAKGSAMDNSAAMLVYAEQLAAKAGAQLQLVDGDMHSFELEVGSGCQSQALIAWQSSSLQQAGSLLFSLPACGREACTAGRSLHALLPGDPQTAALRNQAGPLAFDVILRCLKCWLQEPVDLSFMLMGTFYHLMDHAGAVSCLRSIAAALETDGLLVLELAHAADCFDGSCEFWAALPV